MRYEILGSFRAVDDDGPFHLGAKKAQVVLAALIIRADHVVSAEELVAELWHGSPPNSALSGVHVYISQLRKFIRRPASANSSIVTWAPGYMLCPNQDEIDFLLFRDLMRDGRRELRAANHAGAAEILERALGLWRGPVLSGLRGGPIVDAFAAWLEECRLECLEMLAEAHLMLRRHRETVGPLSSLVREHPLREAFYKLLMLALYRSNRQADALRVYHCARSVLNDELGVEPCRELRDLHSAILLEDEGLNALALGVAE
jgi:SARP family transcriptional regulator, regulator of embCAB operon